MTPSGPCVMTPSLPPRCRKKMSKRRPCAPAAACELRVGQISLQRRLAPLRWPAAARGLGKGLSHASDASLLASGCRPRTAVARKSSQAQQPRRLSYRPSCFASQVPEGLSHLRHFSYHCPRILTGRRDRLHPLAPTDSISGPFFSTRDYLSWPLVTWPEKFRKATTPRVSSRAPRSSPGRCVCRPVCPVGTDQ